MKSVLLISYFLHLLFRLGRGSGVHEIADRVQTHGPSTPPSCSVNLLYSPVQNLSQKKTHTETIKQPPFLHGKQQLSFTKKTRHFENSLSRVHIERAFGRMKHELLQ